MDCRTFRRKHLAFVDDTLPGVDVVAMEHHRSECRACARLDSDVRRSLLLVRNNLPSIQPSEEFSRRLARRLETERQRLAAPAPLFRGPGMSGFVSMSLGLVAIGLMAVALMERPDTGQIARLPGVVIRPVTAEQEMRAPLPVAPPAFVASVSTGMAVWPALLMMEEAQLRYADAAESAPVRAVNYQPESPTR